MRWVRCWYNPGGSIVQVQKGIGQVRAQRGVDVSRAECVRGVTIGRPRSVVAKTVKFWRQP
ncbi:hypothetical protein DPMN_023752 [Dreissena polymorpha]|uniref:Uncharacterized protein n=1 Tax=Dreissena polymorpha TaxID=45954 RepID=A0A9D4LNA2_DREPO|nr:hypothetical protein DPMN_023752 [Dreissena polymorpha]